MQVGSSIVKCDNFIKNQSAVIAGLLAALTGHAKKSDGAPQPLLMQLSRISLFAGVLRETYIPVTLDVHMHWAPVTHAADAVVSDTALGCVRHPLCSAMAAIVSGTAKIPGLLIHLHVLRVEAPSEHTNMLSGSHSMTLHTGTPKSSEM